MAADGDSEKSTTTFRWLDAARYVLALVMTVLIVAVTVHAIKVVLRPEVLSVSVVGGSLPFFNKPLSQSPSPAKNAEIVLDVKVRFYNPSGRVRMYYTNITVYLFGNDSRATSSNPAADSFVFFPLSNSKTVEQLGTVETDLQLHLTSDAVHPPYLAMLYSGDGIVGGVTMRIEGDLITEVVSGFNKSAPQTTYYCTPVIVGGDPDDKADSNRADVSCTERAELLQK